MNWRRIDDCLPEYGRPVAVRIRGRATKTRLWKHPFFPFNISVRVDRRDEERFCWKAEWKFNDGNPLFMTAKDAGIELWAYLDEERGIDIGVVTEG